MKKTLMVAIAMMFLLRAWVIAERHTRPLDLQLVTSFDFSKYPACRLGRSNYCIQAIRFYDADSGARLAEAPIHRGATGPQPIVATLHVPSIPRHVYAVTVFLDGSGGLKEGLPGEVSSFHGD